MRKPIAPWLLMKAGQTGRTVVDRKESIRAVLQAATLLACGLWANAVGAGESAARGAAGASDPLNTGSLVQLAVGMLVVILFIVATAWLLRRVGSIQGSGGGAMKIVAGMSMGTRERLVLVQVGETQLLLGVTPGRVQTLHVLDKPVVTEPTARPAHTFGERLSEALKRGARS